MLKILCGMDFSLFILNTKKTQLTNKIKKYFCLKKNPYHHTPKREEKNMKEILHKLRDGNFRGINGRYLSSNYKFIFLYAFL